MSRLSGSVPGHLLAGWISCLTALFPSIVNATNQQEWQFKVYLDDRPIGYHNFTLTQTGDSDQLNTNAEFDVTFLKFNVFKYRHENVEHWNNQCLKSIASTTDENGKQFRVQGTSRSNGFQLATNEGESTLPHCISTFAYWNKSFLEHDRLLNSQTGEYLEVAVNDLGEQTIKVGNRSVSANRYKLTADTLNIELWYSDAGQWLALQSITSKGRVLRYVIE